MKILIKIGFHLQNVQTQNGIGIINQMVKELLELHKEQICVMTYFHIILFYKNIIGVSGNGFQGLQISRVGEFVVIDDGGSTFG